MVFETCNYMTFEFEYDGEKQVLEVTSVHGVGFPGTYFHMYINRFLLGHVWFVENEWRFWMHPDKPIFTADVFIIIEMIENGEID